MIIVIFDRMSELMENIQIYFYCKFQLPSLNKTRQSQSESLTIPLEVNEYQPQPLNAQTSTDIYGISIVRFAMTYDASFYYQATLSGGRIQFNFKGCNANSYAYRYSYAAFPYFKCISYLYTEYDSSTLNCSQIICSQGQFFNAIHNSCNRCRWDCLTCQNADECLSCNTIYRYFSTNFSCLTLDTYYESSTSIPKKCTSPCKTCQNATACYSCSATNQVLINSTCSLCSTVHFAYCYICNQTSCILCELGYRLINASVCSPFCADYNCLTCNHPNNSVCFTCKKGYKYDNSTATCYHKMVPICGNGQLQEGQLCDDGKLIPWDGCDSSCQIEPNYNCYKKVSNVGFNFTTYCTYNKSIDFTVISIQKLQHSNELTIVLSVSQYQHKFWNFYHTLSFYFIETPIPYRNMRAQFISSTYFKQNYKLALPLTSNYPQYSLFKLTFEYFQPIHNQSVSLCFNLSKTVDLSLSEIPPLCSPLLVYSQNNNYAHLYSQTLYQRQKTAQIICLLISVASVALLIVSFVIGGKRIIVEMLIVIQITYIGLICVPKLTPMYTAMTVNSNTINGYNILYSPSLRPFEDTLSDERTKGVMLYSQFLYNLNTGLLFVLGPLLAGLIAFIVFKIKDQAQSPQAKIKIFYELSLGEYTYIGLLFCSCAVGAASALQLQFGTKDISTKTGMFSLIAAAVMLLLYPIYAILRVKSPHLFEEFPSVLTEDSFGLCFQIIYFLVWNVLSALLCTLNRLAFTNIFVVICSLILYLIVLIKPIFKKNMDRFRTQLNQLSIAFAQLPYLYSSMQPNQQENQQDDSLVLMAPIGIVFVLSVNFIVNIAFFGYEAYKKIRLYFVKIQAASLEDQGPNQKINIMQNPLESIKLFKQGLVQVTEKDEASVASTPKIKKNIKALKEKYQAVWGQKKGSAKPKDVVIEGDYIDSKFDNIDEI